MDDNLNIGDAIDYGQRTHAGSLGDLVLATLRRLEQSGGPGGGVGRREGRPFAVAIKACWCVERVKRNEGNQPSRAS